MLDVTLSILALIAGGVTMELFTAARLPLSGKDEADSGVIAEEFQTGNPS